MVKYRLAGRNWIIPFAIRPHWPARVSQYPLIMKERMRPYGKRKTFTMPFCQSLSPSGGESRAEKPPPNKEVNQIIRLAPGYDEAGLEQQLKNQVDCRTFFDEAPCFQPNCLDQRFHLRLPGRRDPRSSVAEDPVFGQTGGQLAKGKAMGKDLTETMNPRIRQKRDRPASPAVPSFFCAFIGFGRLTACFELGAELFTSSSEWATASSVRFIKSSQ